MAIRGWLGPLLLVALAFLATMHVPADTPARDAFHEGEYLSAWVLPFTAQQGVMPRLIHGGMDHIPARAVAAACDPARQIACIRWANAGITWLASVLFLLTAWLIVQPLKPALAAAALLPAMSLVLFVNGSATNAVDLQQGAPAVRDLAVLGVLLPLIAWCRRQEGDRQAGPWLAPWLPAVAGAIAGLGWFWAYNRGTIALIAVATAATAPLVLRRDVRGLLAAASGIAFGLLVVEVSGVYGSIAGNLDNLAYWGRHRDLYATTWDTPTWVLVAPAALLLAATLTASTILAWSSLRRGHMADAVIISLLSLVTLLYVAQTVARPDRPHLAWALCPVMLLVTALLAVVFRSSATMSRPAIAVAIMTAVAVTFFYGHGGPARVALALVRSLAMPWRFTNMVVPADTDLADPGLREAASAIRAETPACTMAMTNEGLLYLLAATPPCSRFAFPVHIGRDYQQEVIEELRRRAPPVILFDSPFWASRIDGLSLAERTPELAAWLLDAYPREAVLTQGYRLRYRRSDGRAAAMPP